MKLAFMFGLIIRTLSKGMISASTVSLARVETEMLIHTRYFSTTVLATLATGKNVPRKESRSWRSIWTGRLAMK
jgi:hypothetical protein